MLSAVFLLITAIAAAGTGIIYMSKQATTTTQITSVDMSQSRLYVNPTTGTGDLTLVFVNTGTTPVTVRWAKIGLQVLACLSFSNNAQIQYGTTTATGIVSFSNSKASSGTVQGLVLASQTSVTVKFTNLAAFSTLIPPNAEYTVTVYTTGSTIFSFKLIAETSGN